MSDSIQCDFCNKYFDARIEDEEADYDNVAHTGKCIDCQEEWNLSWADRNY